jgi:DNA-binding beta-propeller fold protein YncE
MRFQGMRPFFRCHQRKSRLLVTCLACLLFLVACGSSKTTPAPSASSASLGCTIAHPLSGPITVSSHVQTMLSLPGHPFKSVATVDGHWLFVSLDALDSGAAGGIEVLRRDGPTLRLVRLIPLTQFAAGLALTRDGQLLLVANQMGVTFLDATKAETGTGNALLGTIQDGTNPGTIEVVFTRDDQYAFATDETQNTVSVIDVQRALTTGFRPDALVGHIPVDIAPVGLALAPDNRLLYVTSEVSVQKQSLLRPGSSQSPVGTLSVVDVQRAEHDPSHALRSRVLAGCSPVRVVLSSSGDLAWVTARGSNTVLAFDTARLLHDPTHALLATAAVGTAPVGAILLDHDRLLAVANSNRFANDQTPQTLTFLDTQHVLTGQNAVLGTLRVGIFPRELDVSPDGQSLLLTNYGSKTLSLIELARLPKP